MMSTVLSNQLDASFKDEVLAEPGGEHLLRCYSCGTCMATCLVRRYNPEFNPRRVLRMVMLGMREQVFRNPTIWLCSACDACYPRCPQGIHISELMQAIRNIGMREGYVPPGPVAEVDEAKCSGCAMCVMACPYEALFLKDKEVEDEMQRVSQVDEYKCMSCGVCAAVCPLSAISVEGYSNEDVLVRMQSDGWLSDRKRFRPDEPRVLVFHCNWCSRVESDWAALSEFPPNVRIVPIACSGRVDPQYILLALTEGVDGVLVVGCDPGECHYKQGNYVAQGKMDLFERSMSQMGLDPARVRFAQTGTDDRGRLPGLVEQMVEDVKARALVGAVASGV
jgi:coenzyme F420-reducing hydrogenase delta subunit/heterodisulfide reductase subunit C